MYFVIFQKGCDGVELNVLKDILGEPGNDEFAAELDTQAKTSGKITLIVHCPYLLVISQYHMVYIYPHWKVSCFSCAFIIEKSPVSQDFTAEK